MNKREWIRLVRDGVDFDAVSDAAGVPMRVDGWHFVFGDVGWLARLVTTSVSRGGKIYLTARIVVVASKSSFRGLNVHQPLGATVEQPNHNQMIDVVSDPDVGMRRVEDLLAHDAVSWFRRHETMSDVRAAAEEILARGATRDVALEILASICALRLDREGLASARNRLAEIVVGLPERDASRVRYDWVRALSEADDGQVEEMLRDAARSAVGELRLSKVDVDAFPFPVTD